MSAVGQELDNQELSVKQELEKPDEKVKTVEVSDTYADNCNFGYVAEITGKSGEKKESFGRVSETGAVTEDFRLEY